MGEDKLTHDEQIRILCLDQAVSGLNFANDWSVEEIIKTTAQFENYIKNGVNK